MGDSKLENRYLEGGCNFQGGVNTREVDYKLSYLSNFLSKIDRKGIETYVITRIWNKLDNLNVKIVCQQYVERENGYALLDLYFPQINYGVEVNENYHLSQIDKDLVRKKEVEIAVGVTMRTVHCERSIENVHEQIDVIVDEIKTLIATTPNFKPWLSDQYFSSEYYRSLGFLKVDDEVMLSTSDDVCDLFGVKVPKRGFLRAGGVKLSDNIFIWWPNAIHPLWANEMSADGETIVEYNKSDDEKCQQHVESLLASDEHRITFYRKRDLFGRNYYRFVGVFSMDKEASRKAQKCIWRRISKEYKL